MTDEMLALALENKAKAGATNVEFLRGHIESIPLPSNTVDVIISNCVINLSVDKRKVLAEAFRVLKPGGRFAVSDVVVRGELPDAVKANMPLWTGCVAGALEETTFIELLTSVGFENPSIEPTRIYSFDDAVALLSDTGVDLALAGQMEGKLMSGFVRATKPERGIDPVLRSAVAEDVEQIEALLGASGLPLDGVRESLHDFTVAESNRAIVGVAGLEVCRDNALLRSVAVSGSWRSRGLGRTLVTRVIADAEARGIHALYLLTTTAELYFPTFGFSAVTRDEVPDDVRATDEFRTACPASATVMALPLERARAK
jgi:N-acetylglutamate synthase-like GNAT family acetyltransferase